MKYSAALVLAFAASASAFVPASQPKTSVSLNESLFGKIANLDLWAPVKDSNDYGARNKKNIKQGAIGKNSYVPAGLSADEYNKIRAGDQKKKADSYAKNVAKAGIFQDYTDFYLKRGTDTSQGWAKSVTKGHMMAKTKYDWSGKDTSANPSWTGLTAKSQKKK